MKIGSNGLAGVVHFGDIGSLTRQDRLRYRLFLVVDLELRIGAVIEIDGVKSVVVVAREQGI